MRKTKQPYQVEKIKELLVKAGFKLVEEDYANDYCCVCIDYNEDDKTIIVNNEGDIMIELPTNYYAVLGWLLEKRMASVFILP